VSEHELPLRPVEYSFPLVVVEHDRLVASKEKSASGRNDSIVCLWRFAPVRFIVQGRIRSIPFLSQIQDAIYMRNNGWTSARITTLKPEGYESGMIWTPTGIVDSQFNLFNENPSPFDIRNGIGAFFGSIRRDASFDGLFRGLHNQLVGLYSRALHLSELPLHGCPLILHRFSLLGHNPRLTAIHEPLQYHNSSLQESDENEQPCKYFDPSLYLHVLCGFGCIAFWFGGGYLLDNKRWRWRGYTLIFLGSIGLLSVLGDYAFGSAFTFWRFRWLLGKDDYCNNQPLHSGTIVLQKYLDNLYCCSTVIDMANVLNTDKQIAVISALTEGSSIRSIERMTGVHRDTIMRLGVKVGQGCAKLMDTSMRELPCNRLEMDEIWGFIGKKDRNVREGEDGVGSVWTFCAIDAETKLVPAFKCGNRDAVTAKEFVQDVASRMAYRVQISTDGLHAYVAAMESAYGEFVDYGQIVKTYGHEETSDHRRYSAPKFVSSEKKTVIGNPDERLISTSYIERLNATTRLHMRRLTRLTLAFSKKRENFEAAVALHFASYNFVKRHSTLRCTPAMAAGVTGTFWSVGDLLEAAA
jgi:IS1 family transposase